MNNIKVGSNRNFGIVFSIVFLLISLYPLLKSGDIRVWSLVVSFIFLILEILTRKFYHLLTNFGLSLGYYWVSCLLLIMMIIFFFVVT